MYIESIGLAAPGLLSWVQSRSVLSGVSPYRHQALERHKPALLPPNERRRATELIRLAFRVGEEALAAVPLAAGDLAAVFATSGGDYQVIDQICRVLDTPERALSPTLFHNSVHNSAAGYWSIATGSQAPSVSLSGFDATFAVGLLEAATLVGIERQPTLLAAYDIEPPEPLLQKRSLRASFGVALLLSPEKTQTSLARLAIAVEGNHVQESMAHNADLEALRLGNPAARAIPLLALLAMSRPGQVKLNLPGAQHIVVNIAPFD